MRSLLVLLLTAWALLAAGSALAERVFVRAANGEEGHGWLFGSMRADTEHCWIAVPRHVIDDSFSGELQPFVFETSAGIGGESGRPVGVAEVPGALEAAGGIGDLAFATVVAGPGPEFCLSRLGLPGYAYQSILRKAPEVAVFSLLPTSFGLFRAIVSRALSDRVGGGLIRLRPLNQADGEYYFKQGLSGSVAEVEQPQGMKPLAMIIEVEESPPTALGVRFDLIRAAFELVEAEDRERRRTARAVTEGVPYRIDGFEGLNLSDGVGPLSLKEPLQCWKVAPRGGQSAVRVVISLDDPADSIGGVSVVQSEGCGAAPQSLTVEQRIGPDAAWSVAMDCETTRRLGEAAACPLDLRGPRQLRISLRGRGTMGVNELRLY